MSKETIQLKTGLKVTRQGALIRDRGHLSLHISIAGYRKELDLGILERDPGVLDIGTQQTLDVGAIAQPAQES